MGDSADQPKTIFATWRKFPQPPADGSDYTLDEVLNASTDLLAFFAARTSRYLIPRILNLFGTMMKLTRNDFAGNIAKLRANMEKVPQAKTFRELLQYEIDNGQTKEKKSAAIAALWFKRGLQYLVEFLEQFRRNKEESLVKMLDDTYEATLKVYHGWIVQKAVAAAARMVPYRKTIVDKMTFGHPELDDKLLEDTDDFVMTARPAANALHNLIIEMGLDSAEKV